ncbi:solute carrier family 23 member 1-like [Liolophura sinensis]|uniref:solute carrier family 23 member 1-like n=1 Tax=Liolophura sinensis TaxID=3198878 RepID=UPI0031590D8C
MTPGAQDREYGIEEENPTTDESHDLLYSVEDVSPWYLCIGLGLQQYLTVFGATLTVPLLLVPKFCMAEDYLSISQLISTVFFVSGICTLLQTTIGSRLPIIQSTSFSFVAPAIAILSLPRWCCPYTDVDRCGLNETDIPTVGSEEHRSMWQARITEIQGAITISALFEVVIGFSGLIGFLLRFIGPLAVVPTVSLIGLSLFKSAANQASDYWWIAVMTMFLIALFSQYLRDLPFPIPIYKKGQGWGISRFAPLKLFPVLLGICLSWLVCYILTVTNALTSDPEEWGYRAKTDSRIFVLDSAPWFRFPYPGQCGTPTISTAGVFAMLAGVLSSMVESVGDYYARARLSGAPPPPDHALNRGIGFEGIGCVLAGVWGSGNGTTSHSENIGAIGITKVGSRRVMQVAGITMLLLGCLGKFGALFVTIPTPVVGGMFMITFGMVASVGLSNLQFVDLNSSRNLFILGFSIFFGLSLPDWISKHPAAIQTGSEAADQILTVLCGTGMFVGGFFGCLMDNTIPGTDEERGILKWRQMTHTDSEQTSGGKTANITTYDLPLVQKFLSGWNWTSYLPFCPTFRGIRGCCGCCRCWGRRSKLELNEEEDTGHVNEIDVLKSTEQETTQL